MSEEEKNFDIQFKEWEGKFQAWKEENKNQHPEERPDAEPEYFFFGKISMDVEDLNTQDTFFFNTEMFP